MLRLGMGQWHAWRRAKVIRPMRKEGSKHSPLFCVALQCCTHSHKEVGGGVMTLQRSFNHSDESRKILHVCLNWASFGTMPRIHFLHHY